MNIETLKKKLLSQGNNGLIDSIIQSTSGTVEDTIYAMYFAKFISEYIELEKAWQNWGKGAKKFYYFGSFVLKESSALRATDKILFDMSETIDTLNYLMYNYDICTEKTISICNALYSDLLNDIKKYKTMHRQLQGGIKNGTYKNNR